MGQLTLFFIAAILIGVNDALFEHCSSSNSLLCRLTKRLSLITELRRDALNKEHDKLATALKDHISKVAELNVFAFGQQIVAAEARLQAERDFGTKARFFAWSGKDVLTMKRNDKLDDLENYKLTLEYQTWYRKYDGFITFQLMCNNKTLEDLREEGHVHQELNKGAQERLSLFFDAHVLPTCAKDNTTAQWNEYMKGRGWAVDATLKRLDSDLSQINSTLIRLQNIDLEMHEAFKRRMSVVQVGLTNEIRHASKMIQYVSGGFLKYHQEQDVDTMTRNNKQLNPFDFDQNEELEVFLERLNTNITNVQSENQRLLPCYLSLNCTKENVVKVEHTAVHGHESRLMRRLGRICSSL